MFADTSTTHAHNRYTLYRHVLRGTELSKLREYDAAALAEAEGEAESGAPAGVQGGRGAGSGGLVSTSSLKRDAANLRGARQRLLLATLLGCHISEGRLELSALQTMLSAVCEPHSCQGITAGLRIGKRYALATACIGMQHSFAVRTQGLTSQARVGTMECARLP